MSDMAPTSAPREATPITRRDPEAPLARAVAFHGLRPHCRPCAGDGY